MNIILILKSRMICKHPLILTKMSNVFDKSWEPAKSVILSVFVTVSVTVTLSVAVSVDHCDILFSCLSELPHFQNFNTGKILYFTVFGKK